MADSQTYLSQTLGGVRAATPPVRDATEASLRDFLPAGLLLLAGLVALAGAWLVSGPPSGQYLVVAGPAATLTQTINLVQGSNGSVARMSSLPSLVIAQSPRPDFAASLRRAGAWLIVPLPRVAGCGEPSSLEQIS